MSTVVSFGRRLAQLRAERGPLCAGIDPHPGLMTAWGLDDTPAGLERFALGATEALAPGVALIKPQSAFYERHGSAGIAVLERVVRVARQAGALVLLDVKRGDIGSTSRAYAEAYLDPAAPLAVDAVTVSPYLGVGSLDPFFDVADEHGAGVFVLALTSNPEGAEVQHASADGVPVATRVLRALGERNAAAAPWGSAGAVVGATVDPSCPVPPSELSFNGPILAPGYGAQGGTAADLARLFGAASGHVFPSTSRGLLERGPDTQALSDAAAAENELLRTVLV